MAKSDKKSSKVLSNDERRKKDLEDERVKIMLEEMSKLSDVLNRSLDKIDSIVNELNVTLMALLVLQDRIKKSERRLNFSFGNRVSLLRLSQDVSTAAKILGNWVKRVRKNSKETNDTDKFVNNNSYQE